LEWKVILEEEGVKVIDVIPNMKVHAKLCLIKKMKGTRAIHYGFVSTGNLNEKTATLYSDHCLLTSNRNIMADVNRMFNYMERWRSEEHTSELQSRENLVCRLLLEKKNK